MQSSGRDASLALITPPPVDPQAGAGAGVGTDTLFDQEVEEYSRAQAEDDPDVARKAELSLKVRALREAAEDRKLERQMRKDQHDRQMTMIDEVLEARKEYANKIFLLVVLWLVAIGVILGCRGMYWKTGFELSDKVLLALIGGTTINVLGIFTIVANFLFPKNGGHLLAAMQAANSDSVAEAPSSPKARGDASKRKQARSS